MSYINMTVFYGRAKEINCTCCTTRLSPASRRQRTDIGKYINRTIQHWNQLPAEVLGILPGKPITFKKRVRKVIIELNWKEVKCVGNHRKVERSGV